MRGSPSPWKVFAMMASDAPDRARRLSVSVRESDGATEAVEMAAMLCGLFLFWRVYCAKMGTGGVAGWRQRGGR